jgi:glycosyltransferase involved in cell wall biosynthesis
MGRKVQIVRRQESSGAAQPKPPATVLVLADYGGPYRGSFIPAVRALGREVRARGWRLECGFTPIARNRPWLSGLTEDEIPVHFAPSSGRAELREWLGARLSAIEGPVILHTHFTAFDLPAAAVAARRADVVVIWHVHSYLRRHPFRVALSLVKYPWIARNVFKVVCAGESLARSIMRRGGRADQVVVALNGIDTEHFGPIDSNERAEARASLGLTDTEPVLLHFAWNWQVKGGPLFSETLASMHRAGSPAIGLTVGGGAEAALAAHRLGLGDALRAPDPDEDVRRFYAATDALVATSRSEGSPYSMLEALSCGIPVVATDIPGHRVGDTMPGALRLSPAAPGRIAVLTREVLDRTEVERSTEAVEANKWVVSNRGLKTWAREVAALYDDALASVTAGRSSGRRQRPPVAVRRASSGP